MQDKITKSNPRSPSHIQSKLISKGNFSTSCEYICLLLHLKKQNLITNTTLPFSHVSPILRGEKWSTALTYFSSHISSQEKFVIFVTAFNSPTNQHSERSSLSHVLSWCSWPNTMIAHLSKSQTLKVINQNRQLVSKTFTSEDKIAI